MLNIQLALKEQILIRSYHEQFVNSKQARYFS